MNSFSPKRVGALLRTELLMEGRNLLISLASTSAIFILLQLIQEPEPYLSQSKVLLFYAPMIMLSYGLGFFIRIHMILHNSSPVPFVTTPATSAEKYTFIILLGVLCMVLMGVAIQLNLWVEVWLFPEVTTAARDYLPKVLIDGTYLLNPGVVFQNEALSFLIYFIGILLLVTVLVKQKRFAIPLYFIAPTVVVYIIVKIILAIQPDESFDYISSSQPYWHVILFGGIGIVAFIGAYYGLRKNQLKS